MILFTKHAQGKFTVLKRHKFFVSPEQVMLTLESPNKIDYSRSPLLIAQRQIDTQHVLRVVYKYEGRHIKVITFYPGRLKQYL